MVGPREYGFRGETSEMIVEKMTVTEGGDKKILRQFDKNQAASFLY